MKLTWVLFPAVLVLLTLAAMILGPLGQTKAASGKTVLGPVSQATAGLNNAINSLSGGQPLYTVTDPTAADPRIPAPGADGKRASTALYHAAPGPINTLPAYIFWALFLFVFSYLGANLPIWRFQQPVHYI